MEVSSGSEMTDVSTDAAGAEGSRADEPELTSAVVLAVNFHSKKSKSEMHQSS